MNRLAIITTHPIQYNAPLFKLLAERKKITIKVFYTWGNTVLEKKFDPGFQKNIEWDIPLLEGYDHSFVENIAANKGSHHFRGIDNPTLIEEIKTWNADAVLIYGWSFKSHLKAMRYFKEKLPVFFRGDSTLLDKKQNFRSLLKKYFLRWVYRHVDTAFYVGNNNKAYFIEHGLKESQLVFAPHAIDNKRFVNIAKSQWRNQFAIPQDAIVFLFAGKLEPKKDPGILLEVFIELNLQDTYLLIAGNGVLETPLKQRVLSLPEAIKKRIFLLPFQNQQAMPMLYNACDVFVLPSQGPGETWGLAVNEAMACGKAVLVSDKCGCAKDLVMNEKNGFTFQSGNKEDLKEKILLMVSSKNRLNEMGSQSLSIINEWNFEKVAAAIEAAV